MGEDMERGVSLIEKMIERLGVSSTFGEPVREGEYTIVPVASVMYGFGSGSGYGKTDKEGAAADAGTDKAGGEGSGAGGRAKPIGYVRLGQGEPQFVPTYNPGRVAVAGIFLSAWTIFWITKTIRAFAKK